MTTMHRLETAEADIAYDVHGPLPTADGRPPLFMIGQPMDASGFGAVTPPALVATYPSDVTTQVAHEPPLLALLPDAAAAERAQRGVRDAYQAKGSGAGMAAFMAMSSWRGEYTDDYFAQPAPD